MSSDSCNSPPPVVVCRDHHSRNHGMSLEGILMRQHGVRYGDAKRVVAEGRKALHMSRIEPWGAALQQECERQVRAQRLGRSIRTAPPRRSVSSSQSLSAAKTLAPKTVTTLDDDDESPVALPSPTQQGSEPTEVESSAKIRQQPEPEKEEPSSSMPLGADTMDDWLNNTLEKSAEDDAVQPEKEDTDREIKISVKNKAANNPEEGDSTEHTEDETDSQDEESSEASAATQALVGEEAPVIHEQGSKVEGGGTVTQAVVPEEAPVIHEQVCEIEAGGSANQAVVREETPLMIQEPAASEEEAGGLVTEVVVGEETPVMIQEQGNEGEAGGSPKTEKGDNEDDMTNTEHCLEEETDRPEEDETDRTEEDNDDTRTQVEMMADDSSHATDNSKCFTTAEELEEDHQALFHPTTQVAPSGPEEEQEDNRDTCSVMQVNMLKPVPIADDDEPTVDTSSASVDTIPSFIYILPGPPEVPDDEPLVQSYVLPQRAPTATKRGGYRGFGFLRRKNNKNPQRFGLFRRNSVARLTLSEDDAEMRFQTHEHALPSKMPTRLSL